MMLIDCLVQHLQERADQRGYTWEEVAPCIARWDGDSLSVDIDHPAYPRKPKCNPCLAGTALKKLLGHLGIYPSDSCSCNSRAKYMDEMGCQWCEDNIEEIVGWLKDEAHTRGLPFWDVVGTNLVKMSIRKARVAQSRRAVHK